MDVSTLNIYKGFAYNMWRDFKTRIEQQQRENAFLVVLIVSGSESVIK